MKHLILGFILILPALSLAQNGLCNIAKKSVDEASEIRGLKQKRSVPCHVHNKDQVRDFLMSAIKEKIPPERLKMEAMIFHQLGFIPLDFDYEQGIIDLYLNQLGGYYDPEKKHFVMAGWMPEMLQTTIAVHELTHALQDQYFDLEDFIDPSKYTSDQSVARSALVEGDATAVMIDHDLRLRGMPQIEKTDNVNPFIFQSVMSLGMTASIQSIPETLQLLLVFPYTSGLRFAHTLLKEGGYNRVNEAFKNPPRSTEEILHPEKYLESKPDFVEISDEELGFEKGSGYRDTLGEFPISAYLAMHSKDKVAATAAAAGWGGDRVAVSKDGKRLVWKIYWDTEKDAKEFSQMIERVKESAFPDLKFTKEGDTFIGSGTNRKAKIQILPKSSLITVESLS